MAFTATTGTGISPVGAGEGQGGRNVISTFMNFQDGLIVGRFAGYDAATDTVANVSATTAVVSGVVKRNIINAISDGATFTNANTNSVDIIESGIVTVDVMAGITPSKYEPVFVNNIDGTATNSQAPGFLAVDAYFYQQVSPTVWKIRIR